MPSRSLAALAVIGAFAWMDGAFAQQITRVTLYPGSATIERIRPAKSPFSSWEMIDGFVVTPAGKPRF